MNYDELLALAPEKRFPTALAEARRQGAIPAETPEEYIRRLVHVGEANVRAIQGYHAATDRRARPVLRAGDQGRARPNRRTRNGRRWAITVGGHSSDGEVELHTVSGDHFTMMLGEGGDPNCSRTIAAC